MFFNYNNIYESISSSLSIDASDVETMDKIYFYKKDNLPLRIPTKEENKLFADLYGSINSVSIDVYDIVHVDIIGTSKSLRYSIDKNNRSLTKSKIAASKIYTK